MSSVPELASVRISTRSRGLDVIYTFTGPFASAPEGVYISWTVFLYRARADANDSRKLFQLQLEDRGAGWEPTGWTILISAGENSAPVIGKVATDSGRDRLGVYFPPGFANLSPPFYWFASQEVYRAYLPGRNGTRQWSINGGVFKDCPEGVRASPNSFPYPGKLLSGPAAA